TTVLFFNGGMGATPIKDGENVLSWPSNISSTPVEVAERQSPLFFHYKRLRPGSGGAGRFRGGLGQDILIESRSPRPIVLSVMAERTKFPAPGLAGGAPGGLGDVRINGTRIDNRKQHVLEERTRADIPSSDVEIDGVAELWYDDRESMMQALATPEAKALYSDGALFIGRIKSYTTEEKEIIPGRR